MTKQWLLDLLGILISRRIMVVYTCSIYIGLTHWNLVDGSSETYVFMMVVVICILSLYSINVYFTYLQTKQISARQNYIIFLEGLSAGQSVRIKIQELQIKELQKQLAQGS